jgi:hypothetical protein
LNRGYTRPDAGPVVYGNQAPVTGSHAAIQSAGILQLLGLTEFSDADSSQRCTDGLTFIGPNRLTVDEDLNLFAAGNSALNAKIFIGWFHFLFKHIFSILN